MMKYIAHNLVSGKTTSVLLALAFFLVYIFTLAPGVYGFDSAELATGVHSLGIVHPTGYPLYLLLGKLFSYLPINNLSYKLNLLSAIFASLTIWLVCNLLIEITSDVFTSLIATSLLAASNYFWQMALIAEVYTLHTFFLAMNLNFLVRWAKNGEKKYLYWFAFCYGLSMTNHTSGILFAPGFAWLVASSKFWEWDKSFSAILRMFGLFLAGLLPYIYLPIRTMAEPPLDYVMDYYGVDLTTINGLFWMVSGRAYRFFSFAYSLREIPGEIKKFILYLWRNFLGVGVVIGVPGGYYLYRKNKNLFIGFLAIFLGNAIFFLNYRVIDKDTMFLPAYLIWTILISAGLKLGHDWIKSLIEKKVLNNNFEALYRGLFVLISILAVVLNWRWVSLRDAYGPIRFAEEVMTTAKENGLIIAQWSPAVILEYTQVVEGKRADLYIYNRSRKEVAQFYHLWEKGLPNETIWKMVEERELDIVREQIDERPVYVVEYDPLFAREFEYLPEGNYFQLAPIEQE